MGRAEQEVRISRLDVQVCRTYHRVSAFRQQTLAGTQWYKDRKIRLVLLVLGSRIGSGANWEDAKLAEPRVQRSCHYSWLVVRRSRWQLRFVERCYDDSGT